MQILIADDETGLRESLKEFLSARHDVTACPDGATALEYLEKAEVDLVITDHLMPKVSGLELIRKGRQVSPSTSFLLMTAHGSIEQAVEAIRLGADDYFSKPVDFDELSHRISRIEDLRTWRAEAAVRREVQSVGLKGESRCIRRAREFVSKVSQVLSPVLILGPSGSGKEVLARSIHDSGPRADRPFVPINCASLSEQLMDSELFGHEKGAFTGANSIKLGKFELAKGGTIFLDEIGDLALPIQAKLLRVLQEKEFCRVGGVRQLKSDARVIAATHRPLRDMIGRSEFREDLYFRLNVLSFEMEPLDRRKEDLSPLIDHFWKKHCRELGRKPEMSPSLRDRLLARSYPGNIRELQNLLERIVVLGPDSGILGEEALAGDSGAAAIVKSAETPSFAPGRSNLEDLVESYESGIIRQAMAQSSFNQSKAAELLGISRGALQYKLKKYGIVEENVETP